MQNQIIATDNNQPAISVQQNTVPDNGHVMSLSTGQSLPQQMIDPSGQAHALMVPVTFENYHPAIRLRMAAGLNLPPRFVNEAEKQNGYNVPCLVRHPLALRPPLVGECGGYALPPHVISENGTQPIESNAAILSESLPSGGLPENIPPQPLLTHHGHPIAVRLPLPPDNPQLNPYRSPIIPNEARGATPLRRLNIDEGSPDIDSRIPPRFVRLEGTNFSGLRGNTYRRREESKDFKNGSPDS